MEFKRKGPEVAEIICTDGRRILFSYGEPVAMFLTEAAQHEEAKLVSWLRVEDYISATTERHIAEFLDGATARRVPRAELRKITARAR